MEIVTGSTGQVHVTSIDDAVRNGNPGYLNGKVVFTFLQNFAATIVTNNQVKIGSGYGMNQGRIFKIDEGEFDLVTIENGSQGYKRTDLIVARYTMNTQSGFEDIHLEAIRGTSGNSYVDPAYSTGNINQGATQDDMPLYRVKINGLVIEAVERMFTLVPDGGRLGQLEAKVDTHMNAFNALNFRTNLASESTAMPKNSANVRPGVEGTLAASHGGTGQTTLKAAGDSIINNLGDNNSAPNDSTVFVGSTPNVTGFQKKTMGSLWSYLTGKIRTLLGMGNNDVVPIAHGGTGKTSITNNNVLVGNAGGGFDEWSIDTAPSSASSKKLITSKGVADALGNAGYGDMMKSTYDPNNDGIIAIGQGGTGANTVAGARNALKLGNTDGPLPVPNGGTGTNDGTINGVKLGTNGNIKGYYDVNNQFRSFRQPTGNATAAQVLSGYTFANASSDSLAGSMANRGAVSVSLNTGTTSYQVPAGYHNGGGKVSITTQSKSTTASTYTQSIAPDSGKVLSGVTVNPQPHSASQNYSIPVGAGSNIADKFFDQMYNKTPYVVDLQNIHDKRYVNVGFSPDFLEVIRLYAEQVVSGNAIDALSKISSEYYSASTSPASTSALTYTCSKRGPVIIAGSSKTEAINEITATITGRGTVSSQYNLSDSYTRIRIVYGCGNGTKIKLNADSKRKYLRIIQLYNEYIN